MTVEFDPGSFKDPEGRVVRLGDRVLRVLAVDGQWRRYRALRMANPLEDAETLKPDDDGRVLELGKKPRGYGDIQAQYMGLFKVRADHAPRLDEAYGAMDRAVLYDGHDFANM